MTKKLDENLSSNTQTLALGKLEEVALTPKQQQAWDMTRTALLWNCPAFTHVWFTMMADAKGNVAFFTKSVPTAGTDGVRMLINPEWFFGHTLQERVFVCAHEICHAIFNHCAQGYAFRQRGFMPTASGKKLKWDPKLGNIAMDLVINDLLIESKVGAFVKGGLHDTKFGKHTDSMIDVYEKLVKEAEKNGPGPNGEGFDVHLDPGEGSGQKPEQAMGERSDIEWETAVAAGMNAAKAQGKLPGALERFLKDQLEPEVPWQEKIQAFFARKVGSGSYNWRRPDRNWIVRDIYLPGRSGFGAGNVAVAIDTSGSIGQPELDRFFAEMRGIMDEVRPKKLYVIWCDAMVHKVDEVEETSELGGLKPHGGGGTDFRPPFDWIEKHGVELDAMVYLTDGYGSFPDREPKYPVLWGDIAGSKYPWGDVVSVKVR